MNYVRGARVRSVVLSAGFRGRMAAAEQPPQPAAAPAPEPSERQRLLSEARGAPAAAAPAAAAAPTPAAAYDPAKFGQAIGTVLDDLQVAEQRAISENGRKLANALAAKLQPLKTPGAASTVAPQLEQIGADFNQLVEAYAADGFEFRLSAETLIAESQRNTYIAIAASIVFALLVTVALSQAIVPPIKRGVRIASAIAQGKLDNEISARGRSETAELLRALELMQDAIAEQIERIEHLREEDAKRQQAFQQQVSQAVRSMAETVEREMTLAVDAVEQDTRRMAGVAGTLQQTSANLGTSAEAASRLARNSPSNAPTVRSAGQEPAA